jgi:hypothetical protein
VDKVRLDKAKSLHEKLLGGAKAPKTVRSSVLRTWAIGSESVRVAGRLEQGCCQDRPVEQQAWPR